MEKIQAEFKKDCEETQRTIQQMSKPFAKKLELELNASRFFHIDKGHWRSLLIIYEHLKKYSVKLSPHFIYFLKLDSGLASSIEVLCKPPCDAFSIERIEMAVFSHILLEKTIQPRVKGYLREIIGEEHFEHFKQQLTQGYHAAHVDALRAMLGPLLRPKPVRPKQTMFAPLEVPEEKVEERASCLIL